MNATANPSPCSPGSYYTVTASGGVAPYSYALAGSPPNPPGVVLTIVAGEARVFVPAGTPSGSVVTVVATDSAANQATSNNPVR